MGFINPINLGLFHEIKNPPFVICSNYMLYFGGRQKSLKWCYTPKFHVITCYFFSPFSLTDMHELGFPPIGTNILSKVSVTVSVTSESVVDYLSPVAEYGIIWRTIL